MFESLLLLAVVPSARCEAQCMHNCAHCSPALCTHVGTRGSFLPG